MADALSGPEEEVDRSRTIQAADGNAHWVFGPGGSPVLCRAGGSGRWSRRASPEHVPHLPCPPDLRPLAHWNSGRSLATATHAPPGEQRRASVHSPPCHSAPNSSLAPRPPPSCAWDAPVYLDSCCTSRQIQHAARNSHAEMTACVFDCLFDCGVDELGPRQSPSAGVCAYAPRLSSASLRWADMAAAEAPLTLPLPHVSARFPKRCRPQGSSTPLATLASWLHGSLANVFYSPATHAACGLCDRASRSLSSLLGMSGGDQ